MTATRTLAKKAVKIFSKKSVREGKKVENAARSTVSARRVFSEHSGEDRSGLAPDSLLRESCDPPPASSKSRRSRFRTRKTRRGRRRRRGRYRIDRRAERDARRNASERRFHYRSLANFVNGGRARASSARGDRRRTKARQLKIGSCGASFPRRSSSAASLYCLILLYIVFSLTPSFRAASRRQPLQATSVSRKASRSI